MASTKPQHKLLERVLIRAGGQQIDELLPRSHTGQRADIAFDDGKLIVEIKSIGSDRAQTPQTAETIGEMINSYANEFGGPVVFGTVNVTPADLPAPLAHMTLDYIGKRVQDETDNAHDQICASRQALGLPSAKGILAFITPPFKIDPHVIGWNVNKALTRKQLSGINALITVRSGHSFKGKHDGGPTFISFHSIGGWQISDELKRAIWTAWREETGEELQVARADDFFRYFP